MRNRMWLQKAEGREEEGESKSRMEEWRRKAKDEKGDRSGRRKKEEEEKKKKKQHFGQQIKGLVEIYMGMRQFQATTRRQRLFSVSKDEACCSSKRAVYFTMEKKRRPRRRQRASFFFCLFFFAADADATFDLATLGEEEEKSEREKQPKESQSEPNGFSFLVPPSSSSSSLSPSLILFPSLSPTVCWPVFKTPRDLIDTFAFFSEMTSTWWWIGGTTYVDTISTYSKRSLWRTIPKEASFFSTSFYKQNPCSLSLSLFAAADMGPHHLPDFGSGARGNARRLRVKPKPKRSTQTKIRAAVSASSSSSSSPFVPKASSVGSRGRRIRRRRLHFQNMKEERADRRTDRQGLLRSLVVQPQPMQMK